MRGDWHRIQALYRKPSHRHDGPSGRLTNEVIAFYTLGSDCLWVTFHGDRLYWAFAEPEVAFDAEREPARSRRVIGQWKSTDVRGRPIYNFELSSFLKKTGRFRGTICEIEAKDYLLDRINGTVNSNIALALAKEAELAELTETLIQQLDEADFEIMAARIAEAAGWRIESSIGGEQAHMDFSATLPALGLVGHFQAKTKTDQSLLDQFVGRVADSTAPCRIVLIYHTPSRLLDRRYDPESATDFRPSWARGGANYGSFPVNSLMAGESGRPIRLSETSAQILA